MLEGLSLALVVGQLSIVSGVQFVVRERVYAQMPGLPLVDNVELARLLPFEE